MMINAKAVQTIVIVLEVMKFGRIQAIGGRKTIRVK